MDKTDQSKTFICEHGITLPLVGSHLTNPFTAQSKKESEEETMSGNKIETEMIFSSDAETGDSLFEWIGDNWRFGFVLDLDGKHSWFITIMDGYFMLSAEGNLDARFAIALLAEYMK